MFKRFVEDDEIVADGFIHVERMDDGAVWFAIQDDSRRVSCFLTAEGASKLRTLRQITESRSVGGAAV